MMSLVSIQIGVSFDNGLKKNLTFKTVFIPFLDHIISTLSCRFDTHMKSWMLIPFNITEKLDACDITKAVNVNENERRCDGQRLHQMKKMDSSTYQRQAS